MVIKESTKIKEYCLANQGGVFDVGYLAENVFKDISYDNVRQIVRRLAKSGLLRQYSKGMYLIGESDKTDEERLLNYYLFEGEIRVGMLRGESLFYELGLLDKKPETIVVRTARASREEHVGPFLVTFNFTHYGSGSLGSYEICVALELIENRRLIDLNHLAKYNELLEKYASAYTDLGMKCIKGGYSGNDVVRLADLLEDMDISNRAVDIYVETRHLL